MQVIRLKDANKYLKRKFLVEPTDLLEQNQDCGWANFIDQSGREIGFGYLATENRGSGWLIARHKPQNMTRFFGDLFEQAKKLRTNFFKDQQTTAFRVFNGAGDGCGGITIDWYDQRLVISWYNEFLYQNQELIVASLIKVFPQVIAIYEKLRFSTNLAGSNLLYGQEDHVPLVIKENGVNFATYLNEGLMTGIFLDQREVRRMLINGDPKDCQVLNLFSYTGAFSVASKLGGARSTTSVDLAKRSLAKTQEQFRVNQLDDQNEQILVMDVFKYLNYARKKNLVYDYIIIDPPSFARNGKKTFRVKKDYGKLLTESLAILADSGTILASTNASNWSLKSFLQLITASLPQEVVSFKIEQIFRLPADFRIYQHDLTSNYLKVVKIKIKKIKKN